MGAVESVSYGCRNGCCLGTSLCTHWLLCGFPVSYWGVALPARPSNRHLGKGGLRACTGPVLVLRLRRASVTPQLRSVCAWVCAVRLAHTCMHVGSWATSTPAGAGAVPIWRVRCRHCRWAGELNGHSTARQSYQCADARVAPCVCVCDKQGVCVTNRVCV